MVSFGPMFSMPWLFLLGSMLMDLNVSDSVVIGFLLEKCEQQILGKECTVKTGSF